MNIEKRELLRAKIQKTIWILVVITIFAGLKWPLFGFIVPVVMLTGIIGGFINGRYVCGWLCPRGAFFDRIVSVVSPRRKIPEWIRKYHFRAMVLIAMMVFMIYQISLDPGNIYHWGAVFVRMCIITTIIGIALAMSVRPRAWCSFCPIGTIQSLVGGHKNQLIMDDGCKMCRTCEVACPIGIKIVDNMKNGKLDHKDCLKCHLCQLACPSKILYFESKK